MTTSGGKSSEVVVSNGATFVFYLLSLACFVLAFLDVQLAWRGRVWPEPVNWIGAGLALWMFVAVVNAGKAL